jgi:nicotinate-nucleotide pyrophosphorylase (carboxylating)
MIATSIPLPNDIATTVSRSLEEDVGTGDISAQLIPADKTAVATIWCREEAVLCGTAWANEVFKQLDKSIHIDWKSQDGDDIAANSLIATLSGNARALLTGERCALNFLQTLSGTATIARHYHQQLHDFPNTQILDTRKTIPGLRSAQKYAVACGGCSNHRMGLYDAFLIKENHIAAAGSIANAVAAAKQLAPDRPIEIEVESLTELQQALNTAVDIILLDNFSLPQLQQAVAMTQQRVLLEASGGIDFSQLKAIAATGVDRISLGALTKHLHAIDLSLRFQMN